DKGHTPLIIAASVGDEKIVVLLLNHRNIDVNAECKNGCTALMYTIARGQNKVVELLLRHPKIDILSLKGAKGDNALIRAAKKGYFDVIEELLY
ncbi:ankyrin, partial [Neocallimastix californiae]